MKKRYTLRFWPEQCTGCRRCQLACSFLHTGAFNPLRARLMLDERENGADLHVSADCSACGACADACFFGALGKLEREATRC